MYKAGRVVLNGHDRRAVAKKSRFGREFEQAWWTSHEWEAMQVLHEAEADVPRPVAMNESAILMDYVGDGETAALQLRRVDLSPARAAMAFARVMWNVGVALRHNLIHADLSPFNILWWDGRITIIDLPQAVDPRSNPNASALLARDVANVCRHFERYGVRSNPEEITRGQWMGFMFADL